MSAVRQRKTVNSDQTVHGANWASTVKFCAPYSQTSDPGAAYFDG